MSKDLTVADILFLGVLLVLAIFIWVRDVSWITSSDDTLPILAAIPLFIWLGTPWKFKKTVNSLSPLKMILSAFLFLTGIATDLTLLLTLAWLLLLWTWLADRVVEEMIPSLKKMMVLLVMAFPWIALDAGFIGWWFRLSGAWAASHFFALMGADVSREGTLLVVNGLPISVEAACAGLNTLQSMLISGTVMAFLILGNTNRFWWNLPLLIIISWIANTVRIICISAAAVGISRRFALGDFHQLSGWLVLMLMFGLCWFLFILQDSDRKRY